MRNTASIALGIGLALFAPHLRAQLPPAGGHNQTHDYTKDLSQTPGVAGTRVSYRARR